MHPHVCRLHWWPRLKKDVLDMVSICLVCLQAKAKHMRPGWMLQPLPLPGWKLDCISREIFKGLPPTCRQLDKVWVIIDWLRKLACFIPIKKTCPLTTLARLYRFTEIKLSGYVGFWERLCVTKIRGSHLHSGLFWGGSWAHRKG